MFCDDTAEKKLCCIPFDKNNDRMEQDIVHGKATLPGKRIGTPLNHAASKCFIGMAKPLEVS